MGIGRRPRSETVRYFLSDPRVLGLQKIFYASVFRAYRFLWASILLPSTWGCCVVAVLPPSLLLNRRIPRTYVRY